MDTRKLSFIWGRKGESVSPLTVSVTAEKTDAFAHKTHLNELRNQFVYSKTTPFTVTINKVRAEEGRRQRQAILEAAVVAKLLFFDD